MKNNITISKIIIIFIAFGFCVSMQNEYELWKKAEMLNHQKNKDEALELYLALFQKNKTNYEALTKIKEILIDKENYSLIIDYYNQYLNSTINTKHKFEAEVELLEIKIWNKDISWINDLYMLEEKYTVDQNKKNKFELILHQLFKNKQIEEGYNFVLYIRQKYNIPSFFSRKLISIFKKEKEYKNAINESIIYLNEKSKNHKQSSMSQKILIEQIFDLTQTLIINSRLKATYLPISSKQLSSNQILNLKQNNEYPIETIKFVNDVYQKLIKYNLDPETAKIKLADIQYNIFSDVDSAYKILDELQYNSSKIDIQIQTMIMKSDILISKGYLDSSLKLVNQSQKLIDNYYKKEKNYEARFKKIEVLLYKGDYSKINLEIDSLIYDFELENKNYNDLLELKMITLFFNKDIEQFKKYTSIQYKLKMNKSFESILELIDLINSDNILISELSQFQYALIEFQKGNINNTQKIISDMNTNTVYHEIALVLNAEIEDYINQNYKHAIELYEKIIKMYPDSIYKEDILKRLNKIYKIIDRELEL